VINQAVLDKSAIGLSLLCAVHCLALPLLAVLGPALTGYFVFEESFHRWLVVVVLPLSLVSLWMGCRHHKKIGVVALGVAGLMVLITAALAGHDLLGEWGEKIATLFGASLVALSHIRNFQLCREHIDCDCLERSR